MQAKGAATSDRDGLVTIHGDADDLVCFSLVESPGSTAVAHGYGGRTRARGMTGMGGMGGGMGGMMGGMGGSMTPAVNNTDSGDDLPAGRPSGVHGAMGGGFGGGVHSAAYSK